MAGARADQKTVALASATALAERPTVALEPSADTALPAVNDNYELRELVSVATNYLNQGLVDDAEDLLREALDAGYSRSDAVELSERLRRMRGLEGPTAPARSPKPERPAPSVTAFTAPLPGVERQPLELQRAVRLSDMDLAAGRLAAALDSTLYAVALAPGFLPLYVRVAELRLATGDTDGALTLVDSVRACGEARGSSDDGLLLPMRVALNPDDTEALAQHAERLLAQPGAALEPVVPDAIARLLPNAADEALRLATSYVHARARSDDAVRLLLRAARAVGAQDAYLAAIREHVTPQSAPDLAYLRAAVAWQDDRGSWLRWLELVATALRARPDAMLSVADAFEAAATLMPDRPLAISNALLHCAARQFGAALEALGPWPAATHEPDAQLAFLAIATRALTLREMRHADAAAALCEAIAAGSAPEARAFAEATTVFGAPVSPQALLDCLRRDARELHTEEATLALLTQLRDRFPQAPEIRTVLADLRLAGGAVADGVRELRAAAEIYERAGDTPNMVAAMRRIAVAMPNNAEAKLMIVEGYIQRGVLDEAVAELRRLGDLYVKRAKPDEAVRAYTRGAEIAFAVGKLADATTLYDAATAAQPDDDAIRHAAVAFYLQTGAVERAARELWEVVRIALRAQDPDEAVAALHQIIALTPTDPTAYHRLGEVLSTVGEYAQAERVYRRLAQLTPDDPVLAAKQAALAALAANA